MSVKIERVNRKNAGLWFVGVLSLILAAIAIWYAKYTDWWVTWINRNQTTTLQTINTGAFVLVPTPSTQTPGAPNSSQPDSQPITPSPPSGGSTTDSNASRPGQLW